MPVESKNEGVDKASGPPSVSPKKREKRPLLREMKNRHKSFKVKHNFKHFSKEVEEAAEKEARSPEVAKKSRTEFHKKRITHDFKQSPQLLNKIHQQHTNNSLTSFKTSESEVPSGKRSLKDRLSAIDKLGGSGAPKPERRLTTNLRAIDTFKPAPKPSHFRELYQSN